MGLWGSTGLPPPMLPRQATTGKRTGETRLELLEPTGPDTPVGRFLQKRGPGFHHICFLVDDLQATLDGLAAAGVRLVDPEPRAGAEGSRVAFVHPSGTGGLLVELKEAARGGGG